MGGSGFIIRPAAVLDVPSRSDNDWAEGGLGPWLAGQMQGVTHLPCVIADRWKLNVNPLIMSGQRMEEVGWKKFMDEPGSGEHLQEDGPRPLLMADGDQEQGLGWCCLPAKFK